MTDPRKPIFDAIRAAKGEIAPAEVPQIDELLDRLGLPRAPVAGVAQPPRHLARTIGPAGAELIKRFEGCARRREDGRFEAYPDPGTGAEPWTIGWGSTGKGIGPGTVWTQTQCDARLLIDLSRYGTEVAEAIGDAPTTQNQFDALVSFHYNTGAIRRATLTKLHRQGRFDAAGREFMKWVNAGGRPLAGLVRRRQAERDLYQKGRP